MSIYVNKQSETFNGYLISDNDLNNRFGKHKVVTFNRDNLLQLKRKDKIVLIDEQSNTYKILQPVKLNKQDTFDMEVENLLTITVNNDKSVTIDKHKKTDHSIYSLFDNQLEPIHNHTFIILKDTKDSNALFENETEESTKKWVLHNIFKSLAVGMK